MAVLNRVTLVCEDEELATLLPALSLAKDGADSIGYRWRHRGDRTDNYLDMSVRTMDRLSDLAKRAPTIERALDSVYARSFPACHG